MPGYFFSCDCQPEEFLSVDNLADLREAVNNAVAVRDAVALIILCAGTYDFATPINVGPFRDDGKAIDVRCANSEVGACVLDGGRVSQIFSSSTYGPNLHFQDLTFTRGRAASSHGGAVSLYVRDGESTVTFDSCIFSDNYAVRLRLRYFALFVKPHYI
jgi:hypothetical protein